MNCRRLSCNGAAMVRTAAAPEGNARSSSPGPTDSSYSSLSASLRGTRHDAAADSPDEWIYVNRASGCYRDHRDSHWLALAGRAKSARGGCANAVLQQSEADRPGVHELREFVWQLAGRLSGR